MVDTLRKLIEHQEWADNLLRTGVAECEAASDDVEITSLLRHIAMVQRFFLRTLEGRPFVETEEESAATTHAELRHYAERLTEGELARMVEPPFFNGFALTAADALLQMTMHSQNHRGQCAMLLRKLSGKPAPMDYILWLKDVSK